MKPPVNAPATTYDFLQPPRAADEMGRLGPYRILRVLGSGAMGVVFLAEDTRSWKRFALKVLKPNAPNADKARQRFLREGKATADLHHDHVIAILDVGQSGDVPYLAMEYLQGETLDACLKRTGRLAVAEILRIARETAAGLAAAHGHGLIHRDVKPSNLWLEGKRRRVKVLDFGLARQTTDQTNLTQAGVIVGTPAYMSPEQAKGEPVDFRSDLFSLGCVLYRMCTGDVPFRGLDTVATLIALTMDEPVPPVEHRPDLPPELNRLVLRLLAKPPDKRLPSADLVVQTIHLIEQRQADRPPAPPPPAIAPASDGSTDPTQTEITELAVAVASSATHKRPPRRKGPVFAVIGGAAALVLALVALVVVLARPRDGTVALDADETDVEIALLDHGREAAVLDRKGRPEARVQPGEYDIEVRKSRDGLRLSAERVAVERGDRTVIRVTRDVPTMALSRAALVSQPPRLADLEGWTLETRDHRGPIHAVALSKNHQWLATGGEDATVRVWSYPQGELKHVLIGHTAPVTVLSWYGDDAKTLVSVAADKGAFEWDFDDPRYAHRNRTDLVPAAKVSTTFAAPDGKAVVLENGRVVVKEADKAKEPKVLVQPRPAPAAITALAAAPDGKTIASIHADKSIRLWDANSGRLLHALTAAEQPKPLLAWAPNGKTLATTDGATVRLWDVETGVERKNLSSGLVNDLAWSPDGKLVALSLAGPQLQVWDGNSPTPRTVKSGAGGFVAWSPGGRALVVGGGNVVEVVADVNAGQPPLACQRPANAGAVVGVAWSPDGKAVAESSNTGTSLYDPKTGRLINTFANGSPPTPPLPPGWSPDGKTFLCGGVGKAELRDTATYKNVRPFAGTLSDRYTWSPDSRTLAFAQGGDVRLFETEKWRPRGTVLSPGTDQAVFILATGHYRTAPGGENEMMYVTQNERGQQTLTAAEFARTYNWKNDVRWVRFTER